jgi:hypothetical protein
MRQGRRNKVGERLEVGCTKKSEVTEGGREGKEGREREESVWASDNY